MEGVFRLRRSLSAAFPAKALEVASTYHIDHHREGVLSQQYYAMR